MENHIHLPQLKLPAIDIQYHTHTQRTRKHSIQHFLKLASMYNPRRNKQTSKKNEILKFEYC